MTEQERLALLNQQGATNTTTTSLASAVAPTPTQTSAPTTPQTTGGATAPTTTPTASPSFNMPGVSGTTSKTLNDLLTNGYTPSTTVDTAMKELQAVIDKQPGAFNSQYSGQLKQIMDQILGREKFSYDMNADATYGQYKDQYQRAGRTAMMDTMGQAAQLTGGYGNSYASTAGNQAYQNYLTQLNNIVPELRSNALSEYNAQGDRMNQAYSMTSDAFSREQAQWQDDYNRWLTERDYAAGRYDTERGNDYTDYQNQLDLWYNVANQENAQYSEDKQYAYKTAMDMLSNGIMPSTEMLTAAGLSAADAKAIYGTTKKGSSGSSSSSKSSNSSGSTATTTPKPAATTGMSTAAIDAAARKAYASWARTGQTPNWSSYPASAQSALKSAFNRLKQSTV